MAQAKDAEHRLLAGEQARINYRFRCELREPPPDTVDRCQSCRAIHSKDVTESVLTLVGGKMVYDAKVSERGKRRLFDYTSPL
jgi:hypothetical protein